jgi:hypothetical protein
MIVRVLSEGQYDVEGAALAKLKELDEHLFAAVSGGDAPAYRAAFDAVLALVRGSGKALPTERLVPSDLVLPAPDTGFDEARRMFAD